MSIAENYAKIKAEIERNAAGRTVQLLPVTKMVGISEIGELYRLGCREFAENRIEVMMPKVETLPKDIIWHYIGHLQSNKVRKVLKLASVLHSVDSLELVERIERIAGEENLHPKVFLEISVSGEEQKGGFPAARALELAQAAAQCRNFDTVGLMTMAPLEAPEEIQHQVFDGLRECRDRIVQTLPQLSLSQLSMGMSEDFPEAIRCGATLVRIGSALFR